VVAGRIVDGSELGTIDSSYVEEAIFSCQLYTGVVSEDGQVGDRVVGMYAAAC
jgi:hypothetical protein